MAELDNRTIERVVRRGVAEIISEEEFVNLLKAGKPLRLKMGFDPSRPDIHLGHVVGLRKLRQLQELGHQVILIVGDWTAQIGDPSGQSATRPMLTAEEVRANAESYMRQFFKVVDRERTQAVWQSEWFGKFGLADIIRLSSRFTVAQFLAREDFGNRFREGRPIAITELLYPLLQAYDSVAIQADVEFGGTDQKFNLLVGRELQEMLGQRPQQCFLMPLLVGTDGVQKMSKSLGNYIAVEDPPNEMYGKVMSLPDRLIMDYFELLTDVTDEELGEFRNQLAAGTINPMVPKKRLASDIVAQFHGKPRAEEAEGYFERVFQLGELPDEAEEVHISARRLKDLQRKVGGIEAIEDNPLVFLVKAEDLLVEVGLTQSKSEARRLLASGAVYQDGQRVASAGNGQWYINVHNGSIIRVGRRRFKRLVVE